MGRRWFLLFLTLLASAAPATYSAEPSPQAAHSPAVTVQSGPALSGAPIAPTATVTSATPLPTTAPAPARNLVAKPIDDPALPLRLPGFELRVLDVKKDVLFNVNGTWVQASVPVYFYYPTAGRDRAHAVELLRRVYDDVLKLGQEPEWTGAELQRVIINLDASIILLEKP
jgi:hypothetical protein